METTIKFPRKEFMKSLPWGLSLRWQWFNNGSGIVRLNDECNATLQLHWDDYADGFIVQIVNQKSGDVARKFFDSDYLSPELEKGKYWLSRNIAENFQNGVPCIRDKDGNAPSSEAMEAFINDIEIWILNWV